MGKPLKGHSDEIVSSSVYKETSLNFISAYSSHFGSILEAGLKSIKNQLLRVLLEPILTYEEFQQNLVQVEAILNSTPSPSLSSEPTNFTSLTLSHFFIGHFSSRTNFEQIQDKTWKHNGF